MAQRPRSLRIQARAEKESNTPIGPPEAPMHSEEGSAFDFMQHIPSPIIDAPPTTSQVDAAIRAIVPPSGPPSGAISTSGSHKRPAPYDFMDQIPASQRIARNLPTQDLQPRADVRTIPQEVIASQDSEEDVIQVRHVLKGITTSITEGDSAGPSVCFALPEGSPTEEVTLSDDRRHVGHPRSIPTNLPPMLSGTPTFNAALDAEAEVLRRLLIDMKQMKKELHRLNERLMRDYLILETLIMNICKRPEDLEDPDI
ncbi:hypothetical protein EI94DRAFT_1704560 [Lactarius quietus]|nr:hypothetical protein EI94DRAFT_1704560 [Lactarius quietus]